MEQYLRETPMLNYSATNIQRLINDRLWKKVDEYNRIKQIYNFVRDEILFGYNVDDNITASKVLADGYGQCNTKGTLFMALLRGVNIPCRIHGFTIDKQLQKINETCSGAFCGYGVAVKDFHNPIIDFERNNTYIQSEGITQDFGAFDCPDDLLKKHHQEMSFFKAFLYSNFGRHLMNYNISKIRKGER